MDVRLVATQRFRNPRFKETISMMRDLLTYVPSEHKQPHFLEYAVSLASALKAHLEGAAFRFLPELSGVYAAMPDEFFATIEEQGEKSTQDARQDFLQCANRAEIRYGLRSYTATVGDAERVFGRAARCFDLAIVPQADPDSDAFFKPNFDDTMFLSGRPTLFVPTIQKGTAQPSKMLVCWNGDRWASRAAADALPLMKFASRVDVLQIELGNKIPPECHASEIVRHLKRHDIEATSHIVRLDDPDIGAAILSFAADCESSLIVMGGYGHSRAREALFGGATREILRSMTVPVLMSH